MPVRQLLVTVIAAVILVLWPDWAFAEDDICHISSYQDNWVDPKNPGSGEHAVIWFRCLYKNDDPRVTTAHPSAGTVRSWMVWSDHATKTYQVFVDGWYYWPLRWLGLSTQDVMYSVLLE